MPETVLATGLLLSTTAIPPKPGTPLVHFPESFHVPAPPVHVVVCADAIEEIPAMAARKAIARLGGVGGVVDMTFSFSCGD